MLIPWEALAFVFALLPGIAGLAYCYTCGRKRELPRWSGYWELLGVANKAKSEAYRQTAGLFFFPGSPKWAMGALAWLFSFIVSMVSPGPFVTISGIAICIPISWLAYWLGRRQPRLKKE